jgi:nitronate monooxygenase
VGYDLPRLKIGDLEPRLPIVQGGMAVRISLAPLAAAVANAGGVGIIGASGMDPVELAEEISAARSLTNGVIGVNIMVALKNFADLVKTAIESRVDFITSGAGFSRDVFKVTREARIPFVPVVSSRKAACLSERLGACAVVVEGKEAGGHLGTDRPLMSILREVVGAVKIPVIAAGGIIRGHDMRAVFKAGASGVQLGTRFALSKECSGAPVWKETLRMADREDLVLIKSPVGLPFRAVKTEFVRNLIANNGEIDIEEACRGCLRDCNEFFCIIQALELAQQGDVHEGLFTTGERVSEINDILPADEIIKNLVEEYAASKSDNSKVETA